MTNKIQSSRNQRKLPLMTCALLSLLFLCIRADAALLGYQGQASFNAAIAGMTANTTDFESAAPGTTYSSGTGPTGSGFTLSLGGPDAPFQLPTIGNQFWTTSGSNYLGLNNSDTAFETGDTLTFNFVTPVSAFGLFVIGTADIGPGDIGLTSGTANVTNGATADETDGNGSFAYYIGLVSNDAATFDSVTLNILTPDNARLLPVDVDDVTLASAQGGGGQSVPEPDSLPLFLLSGALIPLASRIRRGLRLLASQSVF